MMMGGVADDNVNRTLFTVNQIFVRAGSKQKIKKIKKYGLLNRGQCDVSATGILLRAKGNDLRPYYSHIVIRAEILSISRRLPRLQDRGLSDLSRAVWLKEPGNRGRQ